MWLVVCLLALLALLPSDRVQLCICPVDGMELALGRTAHTACHEVEGPLAGALRETAHLPPQAPEPECEHLVLDRSPCGPMVGFVAVGVDQATLAAVEWSGAVPCARRCATGVHEPPDPPPTVLHRLRRCTVFLV